MEDQTSIVERELTNGQADVEERGHAPPEPAVEPALYKADG